MPHRLSLRPTGKHRKQRASDYSVTINGLMTCRSLLLRDKPDTLASDLAALDRALKLCGFNEDPQKYMPKCLYQYAEHAAWLEDHRKTDILGLAQKLVAAAVIAPESKKFKGYWQRAA